MEDKNIFVWKIKDLLPLQPFIKGLTPKVFLSEFQKDSLIDLLSEGIRARSSERISLKGLAGSLDAIVIAAISNRNQLSQVVI